MVEALENWKQFALLSRFKAVVQVYRGADFCVEQALTDGKFEPIHGGLTELGGITLNTTARDEHVGNVEHYIHTIKEWTHITACHHVL